MTHFGWGAQIVAVLPPNQQQLIATSTKPATHAQLHVSLCLATRFCLMCVICLQCCARGPLLDVTASFPPDIDPPQAGIRRRIPAQSQTMLDSVADACAETKSWLLPLAFLLHHYLMF